MECFERKIFFLPATPKKVKARIPVYGYNADVSCFGADTSASSDKIHHHAPTILTALSMKRTNEERERERGECDHLGCVQFRWDTTLEGNAVIESGQSYHVAPSRSKQMSTYGIIFLGIQHNDLDGATLRHILEKLVSGAESEQAMDSEHQLLWTIKSNHGTLQNINIQFLAKYELLEIDMVHEAVKTDFGVNKDFVVDYKSVAPDLPGETYYGIEATHCGMCRFDSKEAPEFRGVAMQIKRWAIESRRMIEDRLKEEKEARRKAR